MRKGRTESVRPFVLRAEDRGFEPLRVINPTRFPIVRTRPLCESSTGERTRSSPPRTNRLRPQRGVGAESGAGEAQVRTG